MCGADYEEYLGDNIGGVTDDGYNGTYVFVGQIEFRWPSSYDVVKADTTAHEIGHCFLGKTHRAGSTNNVMTDAISNVAPMLRQCQWPEFD